MEPDAVPGLTLRGSYTRIDASEGENRVDELLFPQRRVTFENVQSETATESDIFSAEIDYEVNDAWTLTSVSGYIDTESDFLIDSTRDETGGTGAIDGSSFDEIFSQEIRATYQNDRLTGMLGAYFFDRDGGNVNTSESLIASEFAFPDPVTLASLIFQTPSPDPAQIGQATAIRGQIVTLVPEFPVLFDRSSDIEIENRAIFG
ncbi:MAG: hypothetical protein AAGJ52_11350, partial [Pseudomonadota bacterium]